jgi:hypothetical protein
MAGRPKPLGPTGRRVASNVRVWRRRRGLSTPQLQERLSELGQPILESGISRLESGIRRTDVDDDLVALAVALDVSPNLLLLPETVVPSARLSGVVDVTPGRSARLGDIWAWAEESLGTDGGAQFVLHSRPHRVMPGMPADRAAMEAWGALQAVAARDRDGCVAVAAAVRFRARAPGCHAGRRGRQLARRSQAPACHWVAAGPGPRRNALSPAHGQRVPGHPVSPAAVALPAWQQRGRWANHPSPGSDIITTRSGTQGGTDPEYLARRRPGQ